MRRKIFISTALLLGSLLVLFPAAAQKKAKQDQLNGIVRMINKDTSTITIRKGAVERQIAYTPDTKFVMGTVGNSKPSSIDELKDGWYVHCFGTFEGTKLAAKSCRFRQSQAQ